MTIKDIETNKWNQIIEILIKDGWTISSEYNNFDKGIDFDAKTLRKGKLRIDFEWDNWTEGEIKCRKSEIDYIKNLTGFEFSEVQKSKSWISRIINKKSND